MPFAAFDLEPPRHLPARVRTAVQLGAARFGLHDAVEIFAARVVEWVPLRLPLAAPHPAIQDFALPRDVLPRRDTVSVWGRAEP